MNRKLSIMAGACCAVLGLLGQARAQETVLFSDDFETDSSALWNVVESAASTTPDSTVDWAWDYGAFQYTSNGVAFNIPPAPNSDGTTRGVKVAVNLEDDPASDAETAAINLYAADQNFSGDYALRFDMWINYNGGAYGGSGSTEFAIFGINHLGTEPNWAASSEVLFSSDGIWFAVTGESGAARDYRNYEGDSFGPPLEYQSFDGGFLDRDGDGAPEQEANGNTPANYPLNLIFPSPPYETPGVPGKRWAEVEVRQRGTTITWLMNGYVIAEKENFTFFTAGTIMLGTMDIFNSIANPVEDNFVVFDNVRVVDLTGAPEPVRVTVTASNPAASEPASSGSWTITRTGGTSAELEVNVKTSGRAAAGVDYEEVPSTVTIPAGQASVEVPLNVLDDELAENPEAVLLHAAGGEGYEVFAPMAAQAEITDDGDLTAVSLVTADAYAYEGIARHSGRFRVTRVGNLEVDLTVNFTVSGTAEAGEDYEAIGSSIVIPAGFDAAEIEIVPIDNAEIDAERTVVVELAESTDYQVGSASSGTVTIRNDDMEPGTEILFADDFDTDTSAEWNVNLAHEGASTADFAFDYSLVGIPPAPNTTGGTTSGLRLAANNGFEPVFTGISVSPEGEGFTGDYRLIFDMWLNYNGPLETGGTGSTMALSAGIGATGETAQFPGSSVEGVLFGVTGEGGSGSDWRAYTDVGAPLPADSGVYAAGTEGSLNHSHPYYEPFGGYEAPADQLLFYPSQTGRSPAGTAGMAWHEVAITKRGDTITWAVDNLPIATVDVSGKEISTNIFLGFFDINTTQTDNFEMSFGLVDNLRVAALEEQAPAGEITITAISRSGGDIIIEFTTTGSTDNLVVVSSETVDGDYAPEAGAEIETVSSGGGETTLRATVPVSTPQRFFQIRQP